MKDGIVAKAPAPAIAAGDAIIAQRPGAAPESASSAIAEAGIEKPAPRVIHYIRSGIRALASLRLTVVLFALSLVLVFYGTWAQVDAGVWTVVNNYFRSAFVWIPLKVISLRTLDLPGAVPYPGGWLLGGLLLANLLAAHLTRFKISWRRAGILIIHSGLVLLMLSELITGLFAIEGNLTFEEGQRVNFVEYYREPELAIISQVDPKTDRVVAVPYTFLRPGENISHPLLPFDIEVLQYMSNSDLRPADPDHPKLATAGAGLRTTALELREGSGAGSDQKIDTPSAYVTLKDKATAKRLDTYLVSYRLNPQPMAVDGKHFEIALRAKRTYRPYSLELLKADHDLYPGTNIPKNFSSTVRLLDKDGNEMRRYKISMNNPLEESGETFYQSQMIDETTDRDIEVPVSVLQVVRNPGSALPYWSCFMIALGMLIHFGMNLISFLERRVMT